MKKERIPLIAGMTMLIASLFNVIWLAAAFARLIDFKEVLRFMWIISPLPYLGIATAFGNNSLLSNVLIAVFILAILLSILGSISTLRRRIWGLAMSGSIGALLCFPILGIAAIILTVLSKRWYVRQ